MAWSFSTLEKLRNVARQTIYHGNSDSLVRLVTFHWWGEGAVEWKLIYHAQGRVDFFSTVQVGK